MKIAYLTSLTSLEMESYEPRVRSRTKQRRGGGSRNSKKSGRRINAKTIGAAMMKKRRDKERRLSDQELESSILRPEKKMIRSAYDCQVNVFPKSIGNNVVAETVGEQKTQDLPEIKTSEINMAEIKTTEIEKTETKEEEVEGKLFANKLRSTTSDLNKYAKELEEFNDEGVGFYRLHTLAKFLTGKSHSRQVMMDMGEYMMFMFGRDAPDSAKIKVRDIFDQDKTYFIHHYTREDFLKLLLQVDSWLERRKLIA